MRNARQALQFIDSINFAAKRVVVLVEMLKGKVINISGKTDVGRYEFKPQHVLLSNKNGTTEFTHEDMGALLIGKARNGFKRNARESSGVTAVLFSKTEEYHVDREVYQAAREVYGIS